eukprot:764289-Hanusia_phi.AAC.5
MKLTLTFRADRMNTKRMNSYRPSKHAVSSEVLLSNVLTTELQIFARDEGMCQYCGSPATTLDHIVGEVLL